MDHFIDAEKVSADYETVQLTKIVIKLTLKNSLLNCPSKLILTRAEHQRHQIL